MKSNFEGNVPCGSLIEDSDLATQALHDLLNFIANNPTYTSDHHQIHQHLITTLQHYHDHKQILQLTVECVVHIGVPPHMRNFEGQ